MSAFASVITPYSFSNAIDLGNRLWQKKVLPVGDIEYQGRMLHFTPAYIAGLANAFKSRAYDQVSFQLADSQNSHTNDPERHRGTIVDMKAQPDGLYVTLQPTPRGEQVLRENPFLGVSARIVEQYQRSDGTFFPAAVQHILGTLDPRIPGLGAWTPIDMANSGAITIDLSGLSFAGAVAHTGQSTDDTLTDAELGDLISAISEAETEDYGDGDELSDAELEALMQAAEAGERGQHDSFTEFDQAFAARQQADAAREDARAAAIVEDTMHPARRDEDRMARIISRAAAGVYDGQQMSFSSESAAVELAMATGRGLCSSPDEFGRCGARFHALDCAHGQNADWLAQEGGPPRSAYDTALSNMATGLALDLTARPVWGDPDGDEPSYEVPQATIELAASLADDWFSPGHADLLRQPSLPQSPYDQMYEQVSYDDPAPQRQMGRPGIRELAERMGLK